MGQMVAEHVIAQATPVEAGRTGMLLLADNQDGFAARVLAARGATVSLDLMYYLWHDDHTGRLLRQEVIKAADRGVRVRMLLDDFNPRANDSTYLALDSHPNISLRLFNPSKARGNRLVRWFELVSRRVVMTRRMHNKAWIADALRHHRRPQHRRCILRRRRNEFSRSRRAAARQGRRADRAHLRVLLELLGGEADTVAASGQT